MTAAGDERSLLSAHLDGELTAEEEARVAELVARDPAARAELDDLAAVRSALRSLPAVDPPLPLARDLARAGRGRSRALVVAGGMAAAAVLVVVALVVGGGDCAPMVPPVDEFVSRHEVITDAVANGVSALPATGGGFEPVGDAELAAMPADEVPPVELAGGFDRMAAFHDPSGTMHVIYARDGAMVSVYAQRGQVDWQGLPPGGEQVEMDGAPAWHTLPDGSGPEEIMVLQHGDQVLTFVASVPHDQMMQVVEALAA